MDVKIKSCKKLFTNDKRKYIINSIYNPLKMNCENNLFEGGIV